MIILYYNSSYGTQFQGHNAKSKSQLIPFQYKTQPLKNEPLSLLGKNTGNDLATISLKAVLSAWHLGSVRNFNKSTVTNTTVLGDTRLHTEINLFPSSHKKQYLISKIMSGVSCVPNPFRVEIITQTGQVRAAFAI